jgi:hypothetical protein
MEIRHFITVEWCNNGFRGVFCRSDGVATGKDEPYTVEEMDNFLGPFTLVLSPESLEMSETELAQYNRFVPLAEYSREWGIALTEEAFANWWEARESTKEVSDECT